MYIKKKKYFHCVWGSGMGFKVWIETIKEDDDAQQQIK